MLLKMFTLKLQWTHQCEDMFVTIFVDNPRPSYRAENPTKKAKNTSPTSEFTYARRKKKRKYQKNTPKIRFSYFGGIPGGYLKGYFGGSHTVYVGGSFCMSRAFLFCSWRGVLKAFGVLFLFGQCFFLVQGMPVTTLKATVM